MRSGILAGAVFALGLVATATGCRERLGKRSAVDDSEVATRESRLAAAKNAPDTSGGTAPLALWVLPQNLSEVSGLALTSDGRLLTHGDELGMVSEIDYRRGVVVKQFSLGRRGIKDDFEGIAVVGDTIYLLASNGKLYQFREGANRGHVEYSVHDTELGKECEFEGLAYDSTINSLLLACKNVGEKKLKDHLVIYRYRLGEDGGDRISHISTSVEALMLEHGWKDVSPTGIDVDPVSGNYVLTTAERVLLSVSPDGNVLAVRELPKSHDQPEGIAITRDSILIIGDEAVTRPAAITLYRWP